VTYDTYEVTRRWSPSSRGATGYTTSSCPVGNHPSGSTDLIARSNKTYLTNSTRVAHFSEPAQRSGEQAHRAWQWGRPGIGTGRQGKDPGGQLGCVSRQAVRQEMNGDDGPRSWCFPCVSGHSLTRLSAELSKAKPIRSQPRSS